ncbi:hypothetical protein ACFL5U_00180 [Candidatus Margulisiibacteriota bacterium]
MAANPQISEKSNSPNLKSLGFNSPMDVIDILAELKVDGEPVIKDDNALLNPKLKAQTVMQYFTEKFNFKPAELPHLAATVKRDLKAGKLGWEA